MAPVEKNSQTAPRFDGTSNQSHALMGAVTESNNPEKMSYVAPSMICYRWKLE